jgi:hypothetical protein
MKKILLLLVLIPAFYACSGPDKKGTANAPSDSASVKDSGISRQDTTLAQIPDEYDIDPPFGLDKIKKLVAGLKKVDDTSGGDGSTEALDDKTYASLSLDEKFTYHMINLESYTQMCDILPLRTDEDHRIYGKLPDLTGENQWSDRQTQFLKDNRDSVMALMKPLIVKNGRVGDNFKEAIMEINGKEMIPSLIAAYNVKKRDHYILTMLMMLMKDNNYPEFMRSSSCKKLYDVMDEYSAFLTYNQANEDLIIKRATNFYNGFSAK